MRLAWIALLVTAATSTLLGCGDESGGAAPSAGAGGRGGAGGEGGTSAPPRDPCGDDEVVGTDGACKWPGVPVDECGEGFDPVDGGCRPILPSDDCPPGTMALPGETNCREVAACGEGTFGTIPSGSADEHVDPSYQGGASDGTREQPWTSIQVAVDAAEPGAIIAVAAGSYDEDVFVHAKAGLQIWGRCPSLVSIRGVAETEQPSALFITDEAPGTTVRGVAITGPKKGLWTIATDTVLAEVWVHDTAEQGIFATDSYGPRAALILRDSLVEATRRTAVFVAGSDAVVERTVVRDTLDDEGLFGRGIYVDRSARPGATEATTSATIAIRRVVLRRNRLEALRIDGADAAIEDTAILDTAGQRSDDDGGIGMTAQWHAETSARSAVTMARTTVSRSQMAGVLIVGSDAWLDAVVIEETGALPTGRYGRGLEVQGDPVPSSVTVRRSLLQDNVGAGAIVGAAEVIFESTIVRRTSPEPTGPHAGQYGFGVTAQASPDFTVPAALTLHECIVADNHVAGVSVFGGALVVERSRVRRTAATDDGLFGDGVLVYNYQGVPTSGSIAESTIADNERAGVAVLGSSAVLQTTFLRCNGVDLDGESTFGASASLADEGSNWCGCAQAGVCQVVSSALAAPDPL